MAAQHPAERLAYWFEDMLPKQESLSTFRVRLYGGPDPKEPAALHTFACMYPQGHYMVYGLDNDVDPPLTPLEIRRRIAECTVPPGKAEEQREILKKARVTNPEAGWMLGMLLATRHQFPFIMYVYGVTANTRIETAYLSVVLTVPIERALQEFKRALPTEGS